MSTYLRRAEIITLKCLAIALQNFGGGAHSFDSLVAPQAAAAPRERAANVGVTFRFVYILLPVVFHIVAIAPPPPPGISCMHLIGYTAAQLSLLDGVSRTRPEAKVLRKWEGGPQSKLGGKAGVSSSRGARAMTWRIECAMNMTLMGDRRRMYSERD